MKTKTGILTALTMILFGISTILGSMDAAADVLFASKARSLVGGEPSGECKTCGDGGKSCTASNPGAQADFAGKACTNPPGGTALTMIFCPVRKGQTDVASESTKSDLFIDEQSGCPAGTGLICTALVLGGSAWVDNGVRDCGVFGLCTATNTTTYPLEAGGPNPCKKPTPKPQE